jgi:beta-phosphoglucomutase-like phosphatase (HAD superfamily)
VAKEASKGGGMTKSKAILFDLDGVLIDSKEIHFDSLNMALAEIDEKLVITRFEQDNIFEGLTTRSKLEILTMTKGLSPLLHEQVWKLKQKYSSEMFSSVNKDDNLISLFKTIKDRGFYIGVGSNAIRQTVSSCLDAIGVSGYVDKSLSNEDVMQPKPSPEIYNSLMNLLGSDKDNSAIVEDSHVGRQAAEDSGARLFPVESRSDVDTLLIERIMSYLED